MTKLADRVIVSANESWIYLDFWPLIAYAYRTVFPGVRVTLVFLSERLESDPFVAQLREHGEVVLIRPVRDITQAAQAKMARYFVAAESGDAVCLIDDIDEIPIDRDWHLGKVAQRAPGSMLLVGREVYGRDSDQAPASMMTAEGHVFRALFNPAGMAFSAWIEWMRPFARRKHADIASRANHEGMDCTTSQEHLGTPLFSDEALIGELRAARPVPVTHVERGYEAGVDTIDRSWWASLDLAKLESGGYIAAHTGRPYSSYREGNDAIMDYLRRRYCGGPLPQPIVRTVGVDADMEFGGSGLTREAYEWVCANVPAGELIVEIGSGHVSTNYLSRYWWLLSVEHDLNFVNIYPSHYAYAPLVDGWYDLEMLREGFAHRRLMGRKCRLLIIDGPVGSEARVGVLRHLDMLPLDCPVLIDDVWRSTERGIAQEIAHHTGRPLQWFGQFAVV